MSTESVGLVGEDGHMRRHALRRVTFAGVVLGVFSIIMGWSLLLAILGVGALDFTFFGPTVASHPGPFVLNDVSLPLPIAIVLVGPLAVVGLVAGSRLWRSQSPQLGLVAYGATIGRR